MRRSMPKPFYLVFEFVLLFIGIPLLIFYRVLPNVPILYLLAIALGAMLLLSRDASFDSDRVLSASGILKNLPSLFLRDLAFLILLAIAVRIFAPELLFSLVKRSPVFWALIMVFYPLVSVYPQEILYRAYFFHRYRPLFGSGWTMFIASACAFGFVHVIFGNWVAIALSAVGGLLFAVTYSSSGSLLLTCIDHALFGDFLFTIGLGRFFYHGFHA
jgi:membrane protease YdiL (CAAX protease family)